MIDYNEINDEIERLESECVTYANVEKLSMLYTVYDHRKEDATPHIRSLPDENSKSEFMSVAANAPLEGVMSVMNEHMDAIKALYPKEYNAILTRIKMYNDIL